MLGRWWYLHKRAQVGLAKIWDILIYYMLHCMKWIPTTPMRREGEHLQKAQQLSSVWKSFVASTSGPSSPTSNISNNMGGDSWWWFIPFVIWCCSKPLEEYSTSFMVLARTRILSTLCVSPHPNYSQGDLMVLPISLLIRVAFWRYPSHYSYL